MEEKPSALGVLDYAMYNERLGHRFYIRAMEKTTDERGKMMFRSIAMDEEEHLRILRKERDSLKKTGNWVSLEKTKSRKKPSTPPPLFPDEKTKVEEMIGKCTSDLDALDIAQDLERRGYDLYREEAEKTSNLTAKAVFQYLAKEENQHFTLLQNTRSYLAARGTWLWDNLHPPMLDGG